MIAIVAAVAANGVIGCNGRIPWDLPEDRAYFRRLTMGHTLLMGRRTYEEIGAPLAGRHTVVISSTLKAKEKVTVVKTLSEAVSLGETLYPGTNLFLCGGERIYREGLALARRLYLTRLKTAYKGDRYFPAWGEEFELLEETDIGSACFCVYERRERL